MDYIQASFSLIGLTISFVFLLVSISWIIKSPRNNLLSYWLLALSTVTCFQYTDFLYISLQIHYKWPILYVLVDAIAVLLPVCAYGYMRSLQGHNIFRNKLAILGHLIPLITVCLVDYHLWLPLMQLSTNTIPVEDVSSSVASSPNGNIYWGLIAVFSLFYWWRQRCHGYKSKGWRRIKFIQTLLLMNVLSVSFKIIADEVFGVFIPMVYAQGPFAAYFIYTYLSFSALPQVVNATEEKSNTETETATATANVTGTDKTLSPDDLIAYQAMFATLEDNLIQGAYKDNDLSLGSLASSCDLTYHQASIAINHFSGVNFYEWVRLHRIAKSKEILAQTTFSVSTIYYDVGFNSKSSFYTAFKKIVGCTPTEYRKSMKTESPH